MAMMDMMKASTDDACHPCYQSMILTITITTAIASTITIITYTTTLI